MTRNESPPLLLAVLAAVSLSCSSDPTSSPGTSAGAPGTTVGGSSSSSGTGGSVETSGGTLAQGASGASDLASGGQPNGGAGGSDASPGGSLGSSGYAGAGGSSVTPPTSCAGTLLCDDFESYAMSAQPSGQWKTTTNGAGSLLVDTLHAYSGTKAAHFHGTVGKDAAYMIAQGSPVFPVAGDTLFVRFMMYIERWSIGNPMHNRLAWVGSTSALRNVDGTGYAMETYNGIGIERIASGHFRTTSQHLTDALNLGQWLCWEFEIDNKGGPIPNGTGTARPHLFREDTELTLAISGNAANWNAVPFDLLQFSLFAYQTDTVPADYWIDDVAMSSTRIGCPNSP